jgi:hypothetical protein
MQMHSRCHGSCATPFYLQSMQVQLYGSPTRFNASNLAWSSEVAAGWPHTLFVPLFKSSCGSRLFTSPGMQLQLELTPTAPGSQPGGAVFNGSWSGSNASYVVRFRALDAGLYNSSITLRTLDGTLQVH